MKYYLLEHKCQLNDKCIFAHGLQELQQLSSKENSYNNSLVDYEEFTQDLQCLIKDQKYINKKKKKQNKSNKQQMNNKKTNGSVNYSNQQPTGNNNEQMNINQQSYQMKDQNSQQKDSQVDSTINSNQFKHPKKHKGKKESNNQSQNSQKWMNIQKQIQNLKSPEQNVNNYGQKNSQYERICKHFLKGVCKNGNRCYYAHQTPQNDEQQDQSNQYMIQQQHQNNYQQQNSYQQQTPQQHNNNYQQKKSYQQHNNYKQNEYQQNNYQQQNNYKQYNKYQQQNDYNQSQNSYPYQQFSQKDQHVKKNMGKDNQQQVRICQHFKNGLCKKGIICKFLHQEEGDIPQKVMKKVNFVCKYFQKNNCKKGDSCYYLHESKDQQNKPNSMKVDDIQVDFYIYVQKSQKVKAESQVQIIRKLFKLFSYDQQAQMKLVIASKSIEAGNQTQAAKMVQEILQQNNRTQQELFQYLQYFTEAQENIFMKLEIKDPLYIDINQSKQVQNQSIINQMQSQQNESQNSQSFQSNY